MSSKALHGCCWRTCCRLFPVMIPEIYSHNGTAKELLVRIMHFHFLFIRLTPGRYQRLDLFIKVLLAMCLNMNYSLPGAYIPTLETKQRECWKFLDWWLNSEFDSRVHGQPSLSHFLASPINGLVFSSLTLCKRRGESRAAVV